MSGTAPGMIIIVAAFLCLFVVSAVWQTFVLSVEEEVDRSEDDSDGKDEWSGDVSEHCLVVQVVELYGLQKSSQLAKLDESGHLSNEIDASHAESHDGSLRQTHPPI